MRGRFWAWVANLKSSRDFSWVIRGLGEDVEILHVESDELLPGESLPGEDYGLFLVYHTGPENATGVIAGEGFIFGKENQ